MTKKINEMREPVRLASAAVAALATALILSAIAAPAQGTPPAARAADADPDIARGRYLVQITGCNDCHTAGYNESGGRIAQEDWLTGMPVGFQGPWGTSYPPNLRLTVQSMTESQWVTFARAERLPPMPWFALRDMSDEDLRAMYRFIRSLGPKGERMPAAVAPGTRVATPFIDMTPKNLPAQAVAASNTQPPRR